MEKKLPNFFSITRRHVTGDFHFQLKMFYWQEMRWGSQPPHSGSVKDFRLNYKII